jgi:GGDEF domain-containing protein
MILHYPTLVAAGGIIVTVSAVTFILNVVLRRNDAVGRLWLVAFVAVMLMNASVLAFEVNPYLWWALGVSNGMFAVTLGFIWAGLRAANGRRPYSAVPFLLGIVVTTAALVEGPRGGQWAGAAVLFVVVAAQGALIAIESHRGVLATLINARILAIAGSAASLYYLARAVVFLSQGPEAPTFGTLFAPSVVSILLTSLLVIGTVTLSNLHVELRRREHGEHRADVEPGSGVVGSVEFEHLSETWLARAERDRSTLVFATFRMPDLDELATAFGRDARTTALQHVGRVVSDRLPAASLLGRLSPSVLGALFLLPVDRDVADLLAGIEADVVRAVVDEDDRFRVSVVTAYSVTRAGGATYEDLLEHAEEPSLPRS